MRWKWNGLTCAAAATSSSAGLAEMRGDIGDAALDAAIVDLVLLVHGGLRYLFIGLHPMRRQFPPATRFLRSFPTLVRALAQHEFLDLAGRGLGQFAEHHMFRPLEPGHLAAAPVEELFGADILAGLQLDKGAGHLAPFSSGLATTAAAATAG